MLVHLKAVPETSKDYIVNTDTEPLIKKPELILACSSDRGLCGAIHSSVSKFARRLAAADRQNTKIVVLGDKAKPQICRDARQNIIMHFTQVGKEIPIFLDAAAICQTIQSQLQLKLNQETTNVGIIYNRFLSVLNYETVLVQLPASQDLIGAERMNAYEISDTNIVKNLTEYLLACRLYWALVEGHAAEMSAKRTAMENATKNAEAMVNTLTMKYNRTRQSVITNELVDIITGASAL